MVGSEDVGGAEKIDLWFGHKHATNFSKCSLTRVVLIGWEVNSSAPVLLNKAWSMDWTPSMSRLLWFCNKYKTWRHLKNLDSNFTLPQHPRPHQLTLLQCCWTCTVCLLGVRCILVTLLRIRYQVMTSWEKSNSQPKPVQILWASNRWFEMYCSRTVLRIGK